MAEKTYKDGLEEAWEIARKILKHPKDNGYTLKELDEIFSGECDCLSGTNIISSYSIHEIKEKIEKWKAEKAKPKHGDVVFLNHKYMPTSVKGIFLYDDIYEKQYWLLSPEYDCPQIYDKDSWTLEKTGKHFDIKEVLESIKGES